MLVIPLKVDGIKSCSQKHTVVAVDTLDWNMDINKNGHLSVLNSNWHAVGVVRHVLAGVIWGSNK